MLPSPCSPALLDATDPRYLGRGGAQISVTADLRRVLLMIESPIEYDWLPPEEGLATTTILASVEDGEITGWEADLQVVLRDAARAGFPAPDARPGDAAGSWLSVTFEDVGEPVLVDAPPERLVRSYDPDAPREVSLEGCGVE